MDGSQKDRLEEFFKKNARNPEIPFNEADWTKLNVLLDKEMPVSHNPFSGVRKLWILPFLATILFIGWLLWPEQDPRSGELANDPTTAREIEERINQSPIGSMQQYAIPDKEQTSSPLPGNSQKDGTASGFSLPNNRTFQSSAVTKDPISSGNKINQKSGYVVSENGADFSRLYEDSQLHFLFPIAPSSSIELQATEVTGLSTLEQQQKIKKSSGFIIGLGYSPDFSTVGIDNFTAPGARWKVYAEYNYKNMISLSTGIEYVANKYKASGDEYHPPYQYWYGGAKPTEAYGECIMIDIPLNLRYQVYTRGRHQLFISAGASTYYILSEDYYFDYDQNDPNLPTHWSTDKMSVYPFSIVNASIGYEYHLRGRGSLQVEPFIKIPTTGIGWGNVDLYTFGAYFSYRFKLGRY